MKNKDHIISNGIDPEGKAQTIETIIQSEIQNMPKKKSRKLRGELVIPKKEQNASIISSLQADDDISNVQFSRMQAINNEVTI